MPSIYLSPSTQEYNLYYDNSGSEEYYMNLLADAMEPYLTASNITFTRNDPDRSLSQAISESNAGNYDLHLALHSNASPESMSGSMRGSDFYYYSVSEKGKRAATVLADNFESIYPDPEQVKTVPTMVLAEVRRTMAPAVLAEIAYHDNPADADWIKENLNGIAENLVQGLCEYFGIPFTTPDSAPGYERIAVVSTKGGRLNLRSRPSLSAAVISQIPNGERVTVIDRIGDWYIVEYDGKIGFASGAYITLITKEA